MKTSRFIGDFLDFENTPTFEKSANKSAELVHHAEKANHFKQCSFEVVWKGELKRFSLPIIRNQPITF